VRLGETLKKQFLLEFQKEQLNPDPCDKKKHHHLRKSVTKPHGKAKTWTLGEKAEKWTGKKTCQCGK